MSALAVAVGVHGQGLGVRDEVVPGLGRLQPKFLGEIGSVNEQSCASSVHQPVVVAVRATDLLYLVPEVVLADGLDDVVERQQQSLLPQCRARDRLAVRKLRRCAGSEGCLDLAFEIVPGERCGLDLDTGMGLLEAGDDLGDGPDRSGIGLRVPDAHDLVLGGGTNVRGQG